MLGSSRELVLSVVAINLVVLIAFVVLTVLQFGRIRTELEQERLRVVVGRASEPLASAAALGLDLGSVRNVGAVLERARQADDAIIALYILDPDGGIVAKTAGSKRTSVSPETLQRLAGPTSDGSYKEDGDYRYLVTFRRSTGDLAGALLMEYSGASAIASVWAMAGRLATAALVFCIISSGLSAWAVRNVLRRESRVERNFLAADAVARRRLWRGDAGMSGTSDSGEVGAPMREAEAQYVKARDVML
ncbi:hypothetical protein [Frigidibacter sp. ROC022]|uniref:hypothetical protein n=1 Tax=Frigidibacter sp. ROC022 TaxID=2971796 RepID=UPI00215B418C|nr:hypothetical protein [Frigidibacter sp. ROC022]MCR8723482.1 hypothetical protein [Frigidibacter sp. ROC022]